MYIGKGSLVAALVIVALGLVGSGAVHLAVKLDQANADLQRAHATVADQESDIAELVQSNARMNDALAEANADLHSTRTDLRQTAVTLEASRTETASLSDALAQANANIDAMTAEVATADATVAAANAEVTKGKETITALDTAIQQRDARIANLSAEAAAMAASLAGTEARLALLQHQHRRLEAQHSGLSLEYQSLQGNYESLDAVYYARYKRDTEQYREELLAWFEDLAPVQRLAQPPLDEERTIVLTLGGDTKLSITREVPGHISTMDQIERSVRMIEDFMGVPFPAGHVKFRFLPPDESSLGGLFRYTHAEIYQEEHGPEGSLALGVRGTIAHEMAHYYWNSRMAPRWLSEGAAEFLQYIVKGELSPVFHNSRYVDPENPCKLADNIVEFLRLAQPADLDDHGSDDEYRRQYINCQYGLGEQLVHALYHGTDDTTFRAAFRDLYHTLSSGSAPPSMRDAIRTAFVPHSDPDQLAAVDRILEERYGPSST